MNKLDIKERFKTILKSLILLLSVFSLHFTFLDGVITARILTIGIVTLIFVIRKYIICEPKNMIYNLDDRNRSRNWFFINLVILVYVFFVSAINNTIGQQYSVLSPTINFFVFCVFFVIVSDPLFVDSIEFAKCMTYAASVQSIIAIISFLFPSFKEFLYSIQTFETWRYNYRVVGMGVVGAGGSVYLACGMITALFLLLKGKRSILLYFQILILFVGISIVGRTGLYYSVGLIFIYYCITHVTFTTFGIKMKVRRFRSGLIIALLCFLFLIILANLCTSFLNSVMFKYTFGRMLGSPGEASIYRASSFLATIPRLSIKTIIGTGVIAGNFDGINVYLDSGYAERYLSYGFIMAFISYATFVRHVCGWNKMLRKKIRKYLNTALVLLLIIEYKEPFVFMMACPYVLIMLARLEKRGTNRICCLGEVKHEESS